MKRSLILLVLLVITVHCGDKRSNLNSTKPYAAKDPETKATVSYQINVPERRMDFERPSSISQTAAAIASQNSSTKAFSARLDFEVQKLVIAIGTEKETAKDVEFSFADQLMPTTEKLNLTSADGLYNAELQCLDLECGKSWVKVSSQDNTYSAEIKIMQTVVYLKPDQAKLADPKNIVEKTIQEFAQYALPVTRTQSEVVGSGLTEDFLVLSEPPVDESAENFAENITDDKTESEIVEDVAPAKDIDPPQSIILQSKVVPTKPPIVAPNRPPAEPLKPPATPTQPPAQSPPADFSVTENPYEAYGIKIPKKLFNGGVGANPFDLNVNFTITPISEQEPLEPAFRIAVLAEAFVKQNVRIKENACNLTVRAIMTLAGYTTGINAIANEFDKVFQSNTQGLRQWEKNNFRSNKGKAEMVVFNDYLTRLPENYAVIMQVDRRGQVKPNGRPYRHGHVGVLVKEQSGLAMYDSSYRERGPRRTPVSKENLLNAYRKNVTIYSIPGLLKPVVQQRSI